MRLIIRFFLLIVLFLVSAIGFAENKAPISEKNLPKTKVELDFVEQKVHKTLEELFRQGGVAYQFPEKLKTDQKISIEVKDASWDEVFNFVVHQSGLSYHIDAKGTFVFTEGRAPASK